MRPRATGTTRYVDEIGAVIRLGPKIAGGGEGAIHEIAGDSGRVVKLYHHRVAERLPKLRSMLHAPPDDPYRAQTGHVSFCWPERLVLDDTGCCAGFVMPGLGRGVHQPVAMFWNAEDRATIAPDFTWKYLVISGANIASLLELLHAQGHVCGDLNEENVLLNDRALAAFVDCDSMQICDAASGGCYRSPVAREAYISPERLDVALADCDRTVADDHWALATLLFQMLMEGQHPTDGVGKPEERRERIRQGVFPFFGHANCAPPKYALPANVIPVQIRRLFERCFVDGHAVPNMRPTAAEWRRSLTDVAISLSECTASKRHHYSTHLSSCIWCEQKALLGVDRFSPEETPRPAAAAGTQIDLPPSSTNWTPGTVKSRYQLSRAVPAAGAIAVMLTALAVSPALFKMAVRTPAGSPVPGPPPPAAAVGLAAPATSAAAPVFPNAADTPSMKQTPVAVVASKSSRPVARPKPVHQAIPPTLTPAPRDGVVTPDISSSSIPPAPSVPSEVVVEPQFPGTSANDLRRLIDDFGLQLRAPQSGMPQRGVLVWSGEVSKNVPVAIARTSTGSGTLSGDPFPGVPIVIESITPPGLSVIEPPSPSNGFQRMVLRSGFNRRQVIVISWRTP
jgi:serine/threonine protein kinase